MTSEIFNSIPMCGIQLFNDYSIGIIQYSIVVIPLIPFHCYSYSMILLLFNCVFNYSNYSHLFSVWLIQWPNCIVDYSSIPLLLLFIIPLIPIVIPIIIDYSRTIQYYSVFNCVIDDYCVAKLFSNSIIQWLFNDYSVIFHCYSNCYYSIDSVFWLCDDWLFLFSVLMIFNDWLIVSNLFIIVNWLWLFHWWFID